MEEMMIPNKLVALTLSVLVLFAVAKVSFAENATAPDRTHSHVEEAAKASQAALRKGPADIPFIGQAVLHLPANYGFIPAEESKRLLEAMGNRVGKKLIGMIVPTSGSRSWFMVATYNKSGYVKDDDARDWKADELLQSVRNGTEETNKMRKDRGIPEMEIVGWVEKPTYDSANHRLVWSIASRDKGEPETAEQGINYNTLALGREGFISMNLVTDRNDIEVLKPMAKTMLASLEFNNGKRYADFDAGTDKVAAYGLAALVAGVAAKKLGFFAIIAAFVAKFAKVIGVAVLAFFGGTYKKFKRKKEDTVPTAGSMPDPPESA
jgi:uncharacterized membrane-anchored protein